MGKDNSRNNELSGVGQRAGSWYQNLMSQQTPLEKEYIPQSQQMWNNYMGAVDQNKEDYSNIMGGYQNFANNLGGPTKFNYQNVKATNPAEQQEAYGYMRQAAPGYSEFAQTGGYSPTDIQELRARGISPIRSAYGNTMMEMNRARALGGSGGSPNYIAAASKAQRELPGQMADATTTVNAQLADAIRQGRLAGLSGLTNIGSTMGGLASQDAGRMLQASMSNQNADLQAQQLSEQSLQNLRQNQLAALSGRTSLYGTTPGMSSMFGNQALQAYQNRINLEQLRNQTGLGLLGAQINAYGGQTQDKAWWEKLLEKAGSIIPYLGGGGGGGGQPNAGPSGSTPMGYNTPNNMGGNQFTGYQSQMPTGTPGNYNTSSNYYFPGYPDNNSYENDPYNTYGDPYLNSNNWYMPYGGAGSGYGENNPWNDWYDWSSWSEPWANPGEPNPWEFNAH
jgi:hypothetical protein